MATRSFEEGRERLIEMRRDFHPMMEAFIEELLAPRGFWGVTAADHLAASSIDAMFELPEDPAAPTA